MKIFARYIMVLLCALMVTNGVWGVDLPKTGALSKATYTLPTTTQTQTGELTVASGITATVTLTGKTLNAKTNNRIFYVKKGGKLTITGGTLQGGGTTTSFNGGAIYVEDGGELVLNGCIIQNNQATDGGAIYAAGKTASITINAGTQIKNNKATNAGGGIYAHKLDIKGTSGDSVFVVNNRAAEGDIRFSQVSEGKWTAARNGSGGGIFIVKNTDESLKTTLQCNIEYCHIKNNYAAAVGGGIYSGIKTTLKHSRISYNRAMTTESSSYSASPNKGRGGGFYFEGTTTTTPEFVLDNTDVIYNACMWYGGGGQICSYGILTLQNNSKIDNNICVLKGAAGLHVTGTATVNMNATTSISNNISYGGVGGGIHSSYTCVINLNGGTISGNIVYGRGGGVHVNTGGELVLSGTDITGNKAYASIDMKYSEVDETKTPVTWSNPVGATGDSDETNTGYGGGILIDSGSCRMESGQLSNNIAEIGGGGIGLVMINMASASYFLDVKVAQFRLNGGLVSGNKAGQDENDVDNEVGDGGAIYLMTNRANEAWSKLKEDERTNLNSENSELVTTILNGIPNVTINGGSVTGNEATQNGGAIYQEANTQFFVTNTTDISSNTAGNSGGAVYIAGGCVDPTKKSVRIEGGNTTLTQNTATDGNGGGIYCKGDLEVTDAASIQISNNQAKNGGGFCVEDGGVALPQGQNCKINNNKAITGLGGGLYVVNNSGSQKTVDFSGGTFVNNEATLGGGACVNGDIILDIASSFENNEAYNGGAIYMINGVKMNFGSGIIKANRAINPIANLSNTAYNATAVYEVSNGTKIYNGMVNNGTTDVYGFGGGIFMDSNTTFVLTQDAIDSEVFGIFNNAADCGADDIFANGNETSITLPRVSTMELSGFHVPNELYWVEDYPTGDSNYATYGTKQQKDETSMRYDESLETSGFELGKLTSNAPLTVEEYACITLGYELIFVDLEKWGLLENDDITFKISYLLGDNGNSDPADDVYIEYRKVILTGKGKATPVTKVIALPSGDWKFEETGWGWKYQSPTYFKNEQLPSNKINSWPVNITKEQNKKIIVVNTLKPIADPDNKENYMDIQEFEHRKRNILRPNKVVTP